ncbi:hypothetical protein COLO4_32572 [Corchorus olitorius]|uniref:Uncharacterized protein n=1 Tax=Corchorus olitorius TaxID=93759 RepID=A0A1R3GYY9_9ROSI|nr:hypothetical protein COLO4_32572 [Corchorus olitorius]
MEAMVGKRKRAGKTHKETTSDPDKYGRRYHETARNNPVH